LTLSESGNFQILVIATRGGVLNAPPPFPKVNYSLGLRPACTQGGHAPGDRMVAKAPVLKSKVNAPTVERTHHHHK